MGGALGALGQAGSAKRKAKNRGGTTRGVAPQVTVSSDMTYCLLTAQRVLCVIIISITLCLRLPYPSPLVTRLDPEVFK